MEGSLALISKNICPCLRVSRKLSCMGNLTQVIFCGILFVFCLMSSLLHQFYFISYSEIPISQPPRETRLRNRALNKCLTWKGGGWGNLRYNFLGSLKNKGFQKLGFHFMVTSTSRQHEWDPALWLTSWAGKMALSCPLRIARSVPKENTFSI